MLTHGQLCERAKRWLNGTRRCNPVFSDVASCSEIPDAIGWSSAYRWRGSTVIECKTSVSDFYADKKKRFRWRHAEHKWLTAYPCLSEKEAAESGHVLEEMPMMGDYRFYFCMAGIISIELVEKHAPCHGLIWKDGLRMRIMRPAPKRTLVDKDSEIRFLRFAIINGKKPYAKPEQTEVLALSQEVLEFK